MSIYVLRVVLNVRWRTTARARSAALIGCHGPKQAGPDGGTASPKDGALYDEALKYLG